MMGAADDILIWSKRIPGNAHRRQGLCLNLIIARYKHTYMEEKKVQLSFNLRAVIQVQIVVKVVGFAYFLSEHIGRQEGLEYRLTCHNFTLRVKSLNLFISVVQLSFKFGHFTGEREVGCGN